MKLRADPMIVNMRADPVVASMRTGIQKENLLYMIHETASSIQHCPAK